MKRISLSACLLLSFTFSFGQTTFQNSFSGIDKYIDSLMKDWNIPGVGLGIVYNDQLIYSKGYGYRDLEQKLPVQTNTIFPIASNTKLFTATAAVMLQEEGKLNLDNPVRTYMPTLAFYNDELNNRVTLRDMLSHRTGLPTSDFIWLGTDFTRKEAVSKVSLMKPSLGFREGYIYNNMMYVASGAVMEAVTGKSWEDIIREKLLKPLQMTSTIFSAEDMKKTGNYALAYFEKDSTRKLVVKKYETQKDAVGPAGSMKSSVEDMSHWMIAQLNGGMYAGKQVVSARAISETMAPNTIVEKTVKYDELTNGLYGLGRITQSYKGLRIAMHTGSIDGFYSNLIFVPGSKIGIFMIHNSVVAGSFRSVMSLPIIDKLLGLSFTPWSARFLAENKQSLAVTKRSAGQVKKTMDSIRNSQVKAQVPSHPLSAYAGSYISSLYGEIKVALIDSALHLTVRKTTAPLNHLYYDYFKTDQEGTDNPSYVISFQTNILGEINRIAWNSGASEEFFVKKK